MKKILLPIVLLLLCLCIVINSCSRMDIAVQFANTYVTNKTDDYFDLSWEQMRWVKTNFNKDFLQVKKIIFPQLATELIRVSDIVNTKGPIEAGTVMISYERVKNLFYDGMRMFSDDAVLLADQLTPKQIVYFQKTFDKKMRDLKDDESVKESMKKMKKQFDSWMGTMTSAQKKELENFSEANPPLTDEKIYNRQLLAHEFVRAYPDPGTRKQFVVKIMTHFDDAYEAKFSTAFKERNNKIVEVVASILNKMTDDQRDTLIETLRDRANQLLKISKI